MVSIFFGNTYILQLPWFESIGATDILKMYFPQIPGGTNTLKSIGKLEMCNVFFFCLYYFFASPSFIVPSILPPISVSIR